MSPLSLTLPSCLAGGDPEQTRAEVAFANSAPPASSSLDRQNQQVEAESQ